MHKTTTVRRSKAFECYLLQAGGTAFTSQRRHTLHVRNSSRSQASPLSTKLLFGNVTHSILGAFYATHSELGYGFLESVYRNALTVLLRESGCKVEREVPYELYFHGALIGRYRADVVVEQKVIVEVKAARAIDSSHCAQLRNYLRASGIRVGLVLNFGEEATFRRIIV